jgi:hypothetical protein
MRQSILYPVTIPVYIWKTAAIDKLLFKRYLHAYLKKNHPEFKLAEIHKGQIKCIRSEGDEARKETYTTTKRRPGESRSKS